MVAHSSTLLAWKIPWTEEPGGLQSMGSQRVRHNWVTSLSLFTFMPWRRKRQPTPVFLPGESQGWGSLAGCCLWGCTELDTTEATQQQQQHNSLLSKALQPHSPLVSHWACKPTPGHILRENHNSEVYTHPSVHCSSVYSSQDMEQPKRPSTEKWVKDVVHICNGILLSHKKNKIMSFAATWMNTDCHTEWSQSDRERQYHMISFICVI